MNYKYLVTGGCSFTTTEYNTQNWPVFLSAELGTQLVDCAFSSQGNRMIARRTVHSVCKLLGAGVRASEILVGVVWSGIDRTEFFTSPDLTVDAQQQGDPEPKTMAGTVDDGVWQTVNAVFPSDFAKNWYSTYHNDTQSAILLYENIHWVQSFLKLHSIDHFMSVYTNYVIHTEHDENPNVKWIKDQVDFDVFVPVNSLHDTFAPQSPGSIYGVMEHPDAQQSENFAINHILPFLQDKYRV